MNLLETTTQSAKSQVFNLDFMGWKPQRNEIKLVSKEIKNVTDEFIFRVKIQSPCNALESCVWDVVVSFDKYDGDFSTFVHQCNNILN